MWRVALLILATLAVAACNAERHANKPPTRSVYVWQRQWTPAVCEAVQTVANRVDRIVVLAAEIEKQRAATQINETDLDWAALRRCRAFAIAIRVARSPIGAGMSDFPRSAVVAEARKLIADAQRHGLRATEFQLDFDCPSKDLEEYAHILRDVRGEIAPTRFVITLLPTALDSPAFAQVAANCDSYVLQVHSVPTNNGAREWKLCDTASAKRWVQTAATYRKPFAVALPTYRCLAGYNPAGQLLGVIMDAVQPRWPPSTRVREVAADPDALADLVDQWQTFRPPELHEIAWYRLPAASDARNWRMPTFLAVASGRRPKHQLHAVSRGNNPVDVAICNNGEADEPADLSVIVSADQTIVDSDVLPGWSSDRHGTRVVFTSNRGNTSQLRPGEVQNVGWLRFADPTNVRVEVARK